VVIKHLRAHLEQFAIPLAELICQMTGEALSVPGSC